MNKIYNEIFDETYYKEKLDNGLEVIIVDWDQTVKYSRKFFYS